jgi:hypothetical protein
MAMDTPLFRAHDLDTAVEHAVATGNPVAVDVDRGAPAELVVMTRARFETLRGCPDTVKDIAEALEPPTGNQSFLSWEALKERLA